MKRSLLVIIILAALLPAVVLAEDDTRKNLAVAEFEARNVSRMDAVTVADFVRTELVKTRMFKVLDRANMAMILEEQQFQLSGCTSQECAVQMGELLNVQMIVIGSLTKLADVWHITASVIDVETGEIAYSERVEAYAAQDIVSASEKLGQTLAGLITGRQVSVISQPAPAGQPDRIIISRIYPEKGEAVLNHGVLDKVNVRNIYEIYDKTDSVGRLVISRAGPVEARGIVIKARSAIKAGMPVLYKARKKAGNFGFMAGSASGDELSGFGVSFYYDYIAFSDWGLQFNLGTWTASTEGNLTATNMYFVESAYNLPIILKKYLTTVTPLSPYIGAGICWVTNTYEDYTESGWFFTSKNISVEDTKTDMSIVLNAGVNVFAISKFRLVFDLKVFLGDKYHGYKTQLSSLSSGLAVSW